MFAKPTSIATILLLLFLSATADETAGQGPSVGVDLQVEVSAGLSGGAQRGQTLQSLALVHGDWEQAAHQAEELSFAGYVSALVLTGRGPSERFLGDFLAASNLEGFPSARLYSWWTEARSKTWSLRGGALLADEEFSGTDAGGNFFNSAFGWPTFISANTINTGPAFYVAAPGLRLERTWGETAAWRVGVYDGDTFDSPEGNPRATRHGLHYRLGGDQGWFIITEADFAPAQSPTRVKLGAWLHTAAFPDLSNTTREHGSNHGAYATIDRTLIGEIGKPGNLEAFVRAGWSPADRNSIGWAIDTGLAWTGPVPSRPADIFALGFVHANFGGSFANAARLADPTSPALNFEQVIEASYSFQLTEKINLQPDLQFIRHPGGSTALRNACLLQLRLNASY